MAGAVHTASGLHALLADCSKADGPTLLPAGAARAASHSRAVLLRLRDLKFGELHSARLVGDDGAEPAAEGGSMPSSTAMARLLTARCCTMHLLGLRCCCCCGRAAADIGTGIAVGPSAAERDIAMLSMANIAQTSWLSPLPALAAAACPGAPAPAQSSTHDMGQGDGAGGCGPSRAKRR